MNKELFDKGLAIRKSVIGAEFVDKALAAADDFNMPLQELVTEYCWGAVWGREGLEKKPSYQPFVDVVEGQGGARLD